MQERAFRFDTLARRIRETPAGHIQRVNMLANAGEDLRGESKKMEGTILGRLSKQQKRLYLSERKTWEAYLAFQLEQMNPVVVLGLWDRYAGGTAGADLYAVYEYSLHDMDLSTQKGLLELLEGKETLRFDFIPVTIEDISEVLDRWEPSFPPPEYLEDPLSAESYRRVTGRSLELLTAWIRSRESFGRSLGSERAAAYGRLTNAVLRERLLQYAGGFGATYSSLSLYCTDEELQEELNTKHF
jgi:hypothetical protein